MLITELYIILIKNLASTPVLFFCLGALSKLIKSNLEIPEQISKFLTIYLVTSIGFKGGVNIGYTTDFNNKALLTIIFGSLMGVIQPIIGYILLKFTTKLSSINAAAVATHYGSISIITFVTAVNFLSANLLSYSSYIISILAIMEVPAVFSGLSIAYKTKRKSNIKVSYLKEITSNGSLLLLVGSFLIGYVSGERNFKQLEGFFVTPFQGFLSIFLLDMGILVASHLKEVKKFSLKLVAFGIYMPLISSIMATLISALIELDIGTGFLFIVLVASSSYIVVTAIVRHSLPEANPAIYIPMSLAITFPFNIICGIPLYFSMASKFLT